MKLNKLENLKLRTSTFGLKNKLGIIAIVCLLIFAGYSGVNATIKLGEDGSGQKWFGDDAGLITNSNGKAWTATGANLQAAVWDLNNLSGYIKLGSDVALTTSLIMGENVTLEMNGFTITPSSSFDVITMKPNSKVINGIIDASGIVLTHSCILFDGAYHFGGTRYKTKLENMVLVSTSKQGIGVNFTANANGEYVALVECINIVTKYMEYAYYFNCTAGTAGATSYLNANNFLNCFGLYDKNFIYIDRNLGLPQVECSIDGNIFDNFQFQADGIFSINAVNCTGDGNRFIGRVWDWNSSNTAYYISSDSDGTYLNVDNLVCMVDKGTDTLALSTSDGSIYVSNLNENLDNNLNLWAGLTSDSSHPYLQLWGWDNAGGASRWCRLSVSSDGSTIVRPQDSESFSLDVRVGGVIYLTPNPSNTSAIRCYSGALEDENPQFYVYGRNIGNTVTKYISMRWGDHTTYDCGIIGTNSGGVLVKDLILYTSVPASPVSGSVYWDESTSKLMIYNATSAAWMSTTLT